MDWLWRMRWAQAGGVAAEAGDADGSEVPPTVPMETMLDWTADWVARGLGSLGKPTHYEARDGKC